MIYILQSCRRSPTPLSITSIIRISIHSKNYHTLQRLGRPRHGGRHIGLQRLEELAQAAVAVVLFVPHVLVIPDLAPVVQAQGDQAVDGFGLAEPLGRILVLHLPHNLGGRVLDDFRLEGAQITEDLGVSVSGWFRCIGEGQYLGGLPWEDHTTVRLSCTEYRSTKTGRRILHLYHRLCDTCILAHGFLGAFRCPPKLNALSPCMSSSEALPEYKLMIFCMIR